MHRNRLLRTLKRLDSHDRALSFRGLMLLIGILITAMGAFAVLKYFQAISIIVPLSEQQLFLVCGMGSLIGGLHIVLSGFKSHT